MDVNDMAVKYKETKDIMYRDAILRKLRKILSLKANYIFYRQPFTINKRVVFLNKQKSIEKSDLMQELYLFTIDLLDKYDGKREFKKYFYNSIWNFKPSIIMKGLRFNSKVNTNVELKNIVVENTSELLSMDVAALVKNETVKKILCYLIENPSATYIKIAKELNVSEATVCRAFKKLKNNDLLKEYLKGEV